MIGKPLRRLEDHRLVTGTGRYVDDRNPDGVIYAVFVRSVEAHALVESVTMGAAPGGASLLTASELGLEHPMPVQNPSPLILQPLQPPALAMEEVCYVGQAIAVVVAADIHDAIDAAEAVTVDYRPLPALVDHRRALDVDAPLVHRDATSNLIATLKVAHGDADTAFAAAPRSLTLEVAGHRGAAASVEGRVVLAQWDDREDQLTLWTSSQAPHAVRTGVAAHLGLSPDEVRVITPDVGGGFGPKAGVYAEEYVVAALARHLGRPVKWTERRREHLTTTLQQRDQSGTVEVAFDDAGHLLALRARLVHDCGAYVPYGVVVPMTTLRLMSGPYAIPAVKATMDCVFTNATPTGAIRGAGRPHANFAVERAVDAVARELGIDRVEMRRRNLVPPDRMPYRIDLPGSDGRPVEYDSGDYPAALEAAVRAADVDGFQGRRRRSEDNGLLRGYGVACYIEDTGVGPYDGARLELLPNGEVLVEVGTSAQGQGHATVFAQIAAHHLGVSPDMVRVRSGDTGRYGQGMATVASRTGQTAAAAVHLTAEELARSIKQRAATKLDAAEADIVLEQGVARVVGQPGTEIPLAQLAAEAQPRFGGSVAPDQRLPGLSAEQVLPFDGAAFTYGTHVVEVEIDPETGLIDVVGYTVVHDCGTLINPMIVDGQIDGGVAHGLGNALRERVRYSEHGQPLTTTFMDYLLTTAAEMPPLTKVHMQTPAPHNPLGAKGAGEGGTIPVASAIASAVEHALDHRVPVNHHPVTPEWVFRALQAHLFRTGG